MLGRDFWTEAGMSGWQFHHCTVRLMKTGRNRSSWISSRLERKPEALAGFLGCVDAIPPVLVVIVLLLPMLNLVCV